MQGGNRVWFTWFRSEEKAVAMEEKHPNTKGIRCDFTSPDSVGELTETIAGLPLEALVNNAMTGMTKKHFHKMEAAEWSDSFQKNILPTLRITQAAVGVFRKQKAGKIVTILSAALAGKPPVGWSEYVAGKAYLLAMSKSWATEFGKYGITSNCVSPSFMLTDLHADTDERVVEELIKNAPLQKLLTPEETADAVHFLLHYSQQMNGANLLINQGMEFV